VWNACQIRHDDPGESSGTKTGTATGSGTNTGTGTGTNTGTSTGSGSDTPFYACIDHNTGNCSNRLKEDCSLLDDYFTGQTCSEVDPPGACINTQGATDGCDQTNKYYCIISLYGTHYPNADCDVIDPLGRCQHKSNSDICYNRRQSYCNTDFYNFFEGETCP
jgi:hypothetical protein